MKPTVIQTRVFRPTGRNLSFLAARLKAGELVGVPTETVYGLAANALDADACRKIFSAKGRPADDPLIVHVAGEEDVDRIAITNFAAARLMRVFWPGPLTIVLPKRPLIPSVVTAGRDSVAVRMPAHRIFRQLLKRTGLPLAAPSANPFGYISPTTADHVKASLKGRIRYILDGGPASIGLESTIVDLRDPQAPRLLRPGAISGRQLERALGMPVPLRRVTNRPARGGQLAPGLLTKHYSPRTPVSLHYGAMSPKNSSDAYVFLRQPTVPAAENVYWLDSKGKLTGVARRLFAVLRTLDDGRYDRIHVQRATGGGLADAINDRLTRAAAQ